MDPRPKSSRKHQNEGKLTKNCGVVSYLLGTYATNDLIAETDAKILKLTQPLNQTRLRTPNCSMPGCYSAIECTMNLYSKAASSKAHKAPSTREWLPLGFLTTIQLYQTWHDTQHSQPPSRMVLTQEKDTVIARSQETAGIVEEDKRLG